MAIRVTCEACDHEFRTRDENAGRKVRCPECGEPVGVAKRKGKSKKPSGGNQTVLIAAIAGVVVMVVAIVIGIVAMRGPAAPANNTAPVLASNPIPNGAAPAAAPAGVASAATPASISDSTSTTGASPAAAPMPNSIAAIPMPSSSTATAVVPPSAANGGGTTPVAPATTTSAAPISSTTPGSLPPNTAPAAASPQLAAASAPPGAIPSNPSGTRPQELSLADLIEKCEPSVVRIDVQTAEGGGNGSGFVVDKTGIIITNYHVIAGATQAICAFRDGSQAKVEGFLKIDPLRDVAIIKVNHPAEKLVPIKLGTTLPRKGEKVVAFGAPLGLSWTATEGIISAFRTKPELANLGIDGIEGDWIQTSTPISPGNSGGPLVTYSGEVVGMNTMQLKIGQNLNFAVQAKEIELVWKQSEGAQLVALAPAALPKVSKSRTPQIIDATKDERGRKALGRLKEVTLVTAMSRDPTGRIGSIVRKKAIDTVRQLGLLVRDGDESDNELMLVTMHFEDNPNSKTGAFEVHVSAVVLMRDRNENGKIEILKVWEKEEKLGSVADRLFITGELPKQVVEKLSSFFGKFKGSFFSAHREADKAKSTDDKSKTKSK